MNSLSAQAVWADAEPALATSKASAKTNFLMLAPSAGSLAEQYRQCDRDNNVKVKNGEGGLLGAARTIIRRPFTGVKMLKMESLQ
jgi:hypothetical protein